MTIHVVAKDATVGILNALVIAWASIAVIAQCDVAVGLAVGDVCKAIGLVSSGGRAGAYVAKIQALLR